MKNIVYINAVQSTYLTVVQKRWSRNENSKLVGPSDKYFIG